MIMHHFFSKRSNGEDSVQVAKFSVPYILTCRPEADSGRSVRLDAAAPAGSCRGDADAKPTELG